MREEYIHRKVRWQGIYLGLALAGAYVLIAGPGLLRIIGPFLILMALQGWAIGEVTLTAGYGKLYSKNPRAQQEARDTGRPVDAVVEQLESGSSETTTPTATFKLLVSDPHRQPYRTVSMGRINLLDPPRVGDTIRAYAHPTDAGVVVPEDVEHVVHIKRPALPVPAEFGRTSDPRIPEYDGTAQLAGITEKDPAGKRLIAVRAALVFIPIVLLQLAVRLVFPDVRFMP